MGYTGRAWREAKATRAGSRRDVSHGGKSKDVKYDRAQCMQGRLRHQHIVPDEVWWRVCCSVDERQTGLEDGMSELFEAWVS